MSKEIKIEWTGGWPSLCLGEWTIEIDGVSYSDKIPEDLRESDMGTAGWYDSWCFHNGYDVKWSSREEGLESEDWIDANRYWLKELPIDESEYPKVFELINKQDFRTGSCGGCI